MNDNMDKYWVHPQADQKDIENMLEKRKRDEQQKSIKEYQNQERERRK